MRKTQLGGGKVTERKYDYNKLRGKIREVFGRQEDFANAINLSAVAVSNKLNNVVDWRQEEMERAVELLDIPYEKLYAYFFTKKKKKNTTFKKEANR